MLLDKFQYLLGDAGVATDVAAIHLPLAQLFHLCILGWHDANGDLRRLAEVRTIECNRGSRPTPQSLPGFLAQALEEPIFHHIASSATLPAGGALPYSITSSARASRVGGISRPIARAVLTLMTSSNLVDCRPAGRRAWRPGGFDRCRRRPDDTCPHDRCRRPSARRLRQPGERDSPRESDS